METKPCYKCLVAPRVKSQSYCRPCRNESRRRSALRNANKPCARCGVEARAPLKAYCTICCDVASRESMHRGAGKPCTVCRESPRMASISRCRPCEREYRQAWRGRNPDKIRRLRRKYHYWSRQAVIDAYGGECIIPECDEDCLEFLELDHGFNDGAEHRAKVGRGTAVYYDLKRRGFPENEGLQVVCRLHHRNTMQRPGEKAA